MRVTLVAMLFLCGFLCTGCESLNKTARWPRKDPTITEQLANDQKRREAAEQELAQGSQSDINAKAIQQTNFPPANLAAGETPDANLLKAKQAEQARQYQVAKSLYEQVLALQPQNAEAHHRLGVLADQDGRYTEAQLHYQAALQQQPQNASLLSDIGYSFYSQDRLDEAEQYLKLALQLQPENQYARNNLAQVYGRRAQQTGSPADYQLAQEQFQLALGPQGAEQQMQQLMPPTGAADDRRSLLNPFKKRGTEKAQSRTASNLQAPDPKDDGNAALVQQMEKIRAEMESRGELAPKRPSGAVAQRPTGMNPPPAPVPFNEVNSELSRIDQEASRQQAMVLRRGYPTQSRGANQYTNDAWNSRDNIEQVAGWENANSAMGSRSNASPQNPLGAGPNQQFNSDMPDLQGYAGQPGNWNNRDSNPPQPGAGYRGQSGYGSFQGNPNSGSNQGWDEGPSESQLSQSWPNPQGAPNQFDARGQAWDGQSMLSNAAVGSSANPAYEAIDPTYNSGTGRSFGTQRPTGAIRPAVNAQGRPNAIQAGWDDGRQAAAQLGLDAGMGDMFPAGAGDAGPNDRNQMGNSSNGYWNNGSGPSQPPWQGTNASTYADPTTPRGMPPGGSGAIAPADYYSAPPSFQNNGYSQGINPAMGENYGDAGGDVSAPWNQPGMSPRNSRPTGDNRSGNDAGQATGRFAPSRPSSNTPQNFGAPPMYHGR